MVPTASHQWVNRLPEPIRSLVLTAKEDEEFERLRELVLLRRDRAITACMLEIGMSIAAMALYDLRRSLLVPIMNTVLVVLSMIGLGGATFLMLTWVQVHGVTTTGLLIAVVLNFVAEALLSETGLNSGTLPPWLVLTVLLVPYSVNLVCSVLSLLLAGTLSEFLRKDELACGLLSTDQLEQQAVEMRGRDLCCVCMAARKDAVLTPCGHKAMCQRCGDQLKARGRQCPLCRSSITSVVHVFES